MDRSYRTADPYRDLDVIDARAPRANQTVVGVVALAGVAHRAVVAAGAGGDPARARADDGPALVPGLRRLLRAAAAPLRRGPAGGLAAAAVREPDGRGRADAGGDRLPGRAAALGAVLGLLVAALALLSAATGLLRRLPDVQAVRRACAASGRGHGHIERIEPADVGGTLGQQHGRAVHASALLGLPPAGARAARRAAAPWSRSTCASSPTWPASTAWAWCRPRSPWTASGAVLARLA